MSRGDITDSQWEKLQPHLPPEKTGKRGGQFKDHRLVINGILWVTRTGAPWRDLPERYGPWQTCHSRLTDGNKTDSGRACSRPFKPTPTPLAWWSGKAAP